MARALVSRVTRSSPMAILAVAAFACVWTSACPDVVNPALPYPEPDFELYAAEVQPVVRAQCASLGCHGDLNRTLTLYAVGYLRAEPQFAGTPLAEYELTDAELAWNHEAMRMRLLDAATPETSRLVLKCIDPALGGHLHADGIVVFEDLEDPDYEALVAWIATGL